MWTPMADPVLQFREDDPFLFGIKIFCSLVILFYLLVTAVFVIIDSVATVTFRFFTIFKNGKI